MEMTKEQEDQAMQDIEKQKVFDIASRVYFGIIIHLDIEDQMIKDNGDNTENTEQGKDLYFTIEGIVAKEKGIDL